MKLYAKVLLALFLCTSLTAQKSKDAILKDPNISWAAEVYFFCNPDLNNREMKKLDQYGMTQTLKLINHAPDNGDLHVIQNDENNKLNYKLLFSEQIFSGKQKIYKDSDLKKPLTLKELQKRRSHVDTVVMMNPKTKKTSTQLIVKEQDPSNIELYKLKVLLTYNNATKLFDAVPLALAPLSSNYDTKGNLLDRQALFWMPVIVSEETALGENIDYAKRTVMSTLFEEQELNVIKKDKDGSISNTFQDMFNAIEREPENHEVYSVFATLTGDPLSTQEKRTLTSSVDTIITFDPETFEEIVQVKVNTISAKAVSGLRIVQDWSWDYKNGSLSIRYLGFAPLINRYDQNGNYLFRGPVFWRRALNLKD